MIFGTKSEGRENKIIWRERVRQQNELLEKGWTMTSWEVETTTKMNFGRKKNQNKIKGEREKTKMNFGRGEKKEQNRTLGERKDKQK